MGKNSKYNYWMKENLKKLSTVIGIILLLASTYFVRVTILIDADLWFPISGAVVTYSSHGWNGCRETSNSNSIVGFSLTTKLKPLCKVVVQKSGYHTNGENYSFNFFSFGGVAVFRLKKVTDPIFPVKFQRIFTLEKRSMNVLSFLHDLRPDVLPEDMLGDRDPDFSFSEIKNSGIGPNTIGKPMLRMKFTGQGGVMAVSNRMAPSNDGSLDYFDLQNLLRAPETGYIPEMEIESGRAYVARLKDGKSYIKFHVFSSKDLNGKVFACMTTYLNPNASRNLEFEGIWKNEFCNWNRHPSNFDLKLNYLKLSKDFREPIKIIYAKSEKYGDPKYDYVRLKFAGLKHSAKLVPNSKFKSEGSEEIRAEGLVGKELTGKLQDFKEFEKSYDPSSGEVMISVFLDGEYLDPDKIR